MGLEQREEKEILEKNNPLTSFKQKTEIFAKDKIGQLKEKLSEKTFDSLDKVSNLAKDKDKKN